jgi:hypothetical protein
MIDFSFFIGQWFGYSIVLAQDGVDRFGLPTWRCHCERCGRDYVAETNPIIQRFPTPCGCRPRRRSTPRQSRGGLSRSRAYRIWADLRRRCRAGGDRGRYQERGIRLHSTWNDDFDAFVQDVGVAPGPRARLERIDQQVGYEPGNVVWTTTRTAPASRLNAHMITANGKTLTLTEWAALAGLHPGTLGWRINAGWDLQRALATAPGH